MSTMRNSRLILALIVIPQLFGFLAQHQSAKADSWKDVDDLIEQVKSTGTKVQKIDDCEGKSLGFYDPPRKDGTGDRLVFCTNNINMEDVSAVWEVLSHESAHVMQACMGGLIWKEEFHPRILRKLKSIAPQYHEILQGYRGADLLFELEAFDMELKTPYQVKNIFEDACSSSEEEQTSGGSSQATDDGGEESVVVTTNSIFEIVGGESSFRVLMDWAAKNLDSEKLAELKLLLKSDDYEKIKETLLILQKRFIDSKNIQNYKLF